MTSYLTLAVNSQRFSHRSENKQVLSEIPGSLSEMSAQVDEIGSRPDEMTLSPDEMAVKVTENGSSLSKTGAMHREMIPPHREIRSVVNEIRAKDDAIDPVGKRPESMTWNSIKYPSLGSCPHESKVKMVSGDTNHGRRTQHPTPDYSQRKSIFSL